MLLPKYITKVNYYSGPGLEGDLVFPCPDIYDVDLLCNTCGYGKRLWIKGSPLHSGALHAFTMEALEHKKHCAYRETFQLGSATLSINGALIGTAYSITCTDGGSYNA